MGILTIQRRMRELGRIRLGLQEEYRKDGQTRKKPKKLTTFRLTSPSQDLIQAVAAQYGGTVAAWDSPRGREWETVIESPWLDVIVPPEEAGDQWMELWAGGGCQRRCDGITEQLSGKPCMCPAAPKVRQAAAANGDACKPTTRLYVALPSIPDLGVWRLETHSYYAAVELSGTVATLRAAAEQGVYIRARLRIDSRQIKRPNEPRKDFIVPVLELPDLVLNQLLPAGPVTGGQRSLGTGAPVGQRALPPGPELPARSELRPPAPATAPVAAQDDEEPTEAAFVPVDGFGDAPVPVLELGPEEFVTWIRERVRGIDGRFVSGVKEDLFGERNQLTDEERGRLALEVVRRSKEATPA